MPRGKRKRKEPARQMAWMMTRAVTEPGRAITCVSDVPEIVGIVMEPDCTVVVISTKKTPKPHIQGLVMFATGIIGSGSWRH